MSTGNDEHSTTAGTMVDYRIRVINIGLIVSWLGLVLFGIWGLTRAGDDQTTEIGLLIGLGAALVLLTVAPWRSSIQSAVGDWLIVGWSLAVLIAQLVVILREDLPSNGLGFLVVPFFAAATAIALPQLIVVEVASISAYWVALGESSGYTSASTATSLLVFAAASVFILLVSVRVRDQFEETSSRYDELVEHEADLAKRERELSSLYDVSTAIGAGSKISDVLPELIGKVADAVSAPVGLVLRHNGDADTLELLSPIWVNGHIITTDPFAVSLQKPGLAQRVFISGSPAVVDRVDGEDRLLDELDAKNAAAVALRVGDTPIGVLIASDKDHAFTKEDLDTLAALAVPAALVLDQMSRYEEARVSSQRMTEVAEMKTEFVSVVSHELRTPLTSIIGALRTLQRPELRGEDDRANQLVDMAAKQANRLRTLIEDLLVMSRLEATSLPVRPIQIAFDPFIADTLRTIHDTDDVAVEIADEATVVVADPDHLGRILTNLVENALKYGTDPETGGSDVTVRTSRVGDNIRLSVADRGPGIPYDKHDLVFQRFTQLAPNATRSKGGAGLGLSIVHGLAEVMGGRVWYEPTLGGGATFTLSLPVKEEQGSRE